MLLVPCEKIEFPTALLSWRLFSAAWKTSMASLKYFPPKVIQLVIHDHSAGNWTLKLMLSLTITIMTWNLLAPTGNHKINSVQLGFLIEPHNIKLNHYNRSRCICIWNSVTYKLQNVVSYHVIWPIWYVAVLGTEPASFYVEVHYEVGKICILKQ